MPYRVTFVDWLLLAGLVVAWGSSFVMSKIALVDVTPAWIAASRLVIGAALLLLSPWRNVPPSRKTSVH